MLTNSLKIQETLKLRVIKNIDSRLESNILKNGIKDPLILRKDNILVDGLQRYMIAVKHSIEDVPVVHING